MPSLRSARAVSFRASVTPIQRKGSGGQAVNQATFPSKATPGTIEERAPEAMMPRQRCVKRISSSRGKVGRMKASFEGEPALRREGLLSLDRYRVTVTL